MSNQELLAPIPGDNPAGLHLRYDPLYDEIKEARREDDGLPQGDWETARKTADWPLVIRLTTGALSKTTKDLQIAAWLTEARLRREGFAGLRDGLDLLRELAEGFWESVYPEVDDGDAEMRAAPLAWVGLKLDVAVRSVPLTHARHSLIDYRHTRAVPTKEEAESDSSKAEQREQALQEGKHAPEEFEDGFVATSKDEVRRLVGDIDATLESIESLDGLCTSRFERSIAPNFAPLRDAVQEVRHVAGQLLARKLELEPDPVDASTAVADVDPPAADAGSHGESESNTARNAIAAGPRTRDEAAAWIAAAARRLRQDRPTDPAPFLMLRGFRWGELRGPGGDDPRLLAAPSTQVRTKLKGLLLDASWVELIDSAEEALAQPYGRGWLDLQRYALTATDGLGEDYDAVGAGIRGALRALLADRPDLPLQTMMDDSPTANAETRSWLQESNLMPDGADAAHVPEDPRPTPRPTVIARRDAYDAARARVNAGDPRGAMELLMREATREKSARAKFLRRAQAAEIMVDAKMESVALPILREMLDQVEAHRLEEWEAGETVAQPLDLLYRCVITMNSGEVDPQ